MPSLRSKASKNQKEHEVDQANRFCRHGYDQVGFTKEFIDTEIGFGVFTTKSFQKGSFLLEYPGELVSDKEGENRHLDYGRRSLGSFLYFFEDGKKKLCIDGTFAEQLGRFVNDSVYGNAVMKRVSVDGQTRLCLFALKEIPFGEELRYDYGDTGLSWRKKSIYKKALKLKDIRKDYGIMYDPKEVKPPPPKASEVLKSFAKPAAMKVDDNYKDQDLAYDDVDFVCTEKIFESNEVVVIDEIDDQIPQKQIAMAEKSVSSLVEIEVVSSIDNSNPQVNEEEVIKPCSSLVSEDITHIAVQKNDDNGDMAVKELNHAVTVEELVSEDITQGPVQRNADNDDVAVKEPNHAVTVEELVSEDITQDPVQRNDDNDDVAVKELNHAVTVEELVTEDIDVAMNESYDVAEENVSTDVAVKSCDTTTGLEECYRCHKKDKSSTCKYLSCADNGKYFCGSCFDDHTCRKYEEENEKHVDKEMAVEMPAKSNTVEKESSEILLQNVKSVSIEHIKSMVDELADTLSGIFSGKVYSKRHRDFVNRGDLESVMMKVGSIHFTDEQEGAILQKLLEMFCSKNMNDFGYVMKVIFPETRTLLLANIKGVSYYEVDDFINEGEVETQPSKMQEPVQEIADSKKPPLSGKKRFKCDECETAVIDLPRHMRNVHKWDFSKARQANKLFQNGTYVWKNGPPIKSKQKQKKNDNDMEEVPTKLPKKDYHKKKACPFPGCHSVVLRLSKHLRNVHNVNEVDYSFYISNATNYFKKSNNKEILAKAKAGIRREKYRDLLQSDYILPNFNENNSKNNYIAPNKETFDVIDIAATAKSTDIEQSTPSEVVPSISNEQLFKDFYEYLISVDGGRLCDKRTAPQYSQMVKTILNCLNDDVSMLCQKKIIRTKFLMKYCVEKEYAPMTIKKYLTALHHFYGFILDEEINIVGFIPEDILRMKVRVVNWSSSYNDDVKERDNVKSEEDLEVLITPEQIKKYENSEGARNAIKLFSSFSKEPLPSLTRTDYCCMRDYLFFQIELQNSHRSGVSSNMLVDEFHKATREGEFMRVKVKEHKTKKDYGPAKVYLKHHVYNYLKILVCNVRSCLPVIISRNHVFLSFNGISMESGAISKQLNSIWQRAGVYDGMSDQPTKKISSTVFRKSVSTAVLEHQPGNAAEVASLLAHSIKTQGKYYNARRIDLATASGAHHVENLLRFGGEVNINSASVGSPKKIWSEQEVKEIRALFGEELNERNISVEIVERQRNLFIVLKNIPARKIYDKVRSLWRYDSKICDSPKQLPTETGNDRCARLLKDSFDMPVKADESSSSGEEYILPSVSGMSSSLVSGKEKVFPADDSNKLLEWCAKVISIGPISAHRVESCFDTKEKSDFLNYYGIEKIVNRVKYERRKKKK